MAVRVQDAWERERGGAPEVVTKLQARTNKGPGWSSVKKRGEKL